MGSSNSSRIDDTNYLRLVPSDAPDADIAHILQYLIRSGQVHIIADRDGSSDDEFTPPLNPPRVVANPKTDVIDKSEYSYFTRKASGLIEKEGYKRPNNLASLISARERGLPGISSLHRGDRCRVLNTFLPNTREVVTSFGSKIFCGIHSQDGNTFLTASQDKKLRLFDTSKSAPVLKQTMVGVNVGWSILDVAFSPDGERIAYSSWSETLNMCRLDDKSDTHETMLLCPSDRRFCVFSLKFSSDGKEILSGANDGCVYIYDVVRDERVARISSHDDDVNSVAFADDTSKIIYSGSDDGLVKVWDRRTLSEAHPTPVGLLAGHMDGVTHVEPRGDTRHLLSNSKDQSIKLWDVRVFSSSDAVDNAKNAVAHQSWDYRWQTIPKALKNPKKKIQGDTSLMTYCGHAVLQTLCRCHFSPIITTGQRYIYAGCALGRIVVYDSLTGKIEAELNGHRACVRGVSWHPTRPEILSTSWDGSIYYWMYYNGDAEECAELPEDLPFVVRRSQRLREQAMKRKARDLDQGFDL